MLKREELGAITVSTHLGTINFNEKGESHDLSDNQQKSLADVVPTYTYVEDKPKAKPQAKAEPKLSQKQLQLQEKHQNVRLQLKQHQLKKEETKEEDAK